MESRSLCIILLMIIMILLGVQDKEVDAVSLHICPNRLQFFEYEAVTFYCEGVDYCEVVHKFKGKVKSCNKTNERTAAGSSCKIKTAYTDDSGEYWYETEGGMRSNSINISVTDGAVILESPAVPVLMEETVTLSCRNKTASSSFTADFYKNGYLIHRGSTGNMTLQRVSELDEGLYKCNIIGAGESPESWLNVTDVNYITTPDGHQDMSHSSSAATPWIICIILFTALLVAVGLYRFGKGSYWDRALCCQSTRVDCADSAVDGTVYIEASTVDADRATYAVVRKNRKRKEDEGVLPSRPVHYNYAIRDTQPQESEAGTNTKMSSAGIYRPIAEDPSYSTIQMVGDRAD
ncbi:uncharacterized protein LOC106096549 isoform X3 [Oreochromis niloticus]|uniref:Uncharacterized LOC106096549 n=1 Tax=Oreochromis niloticus TaxID=8128 RepID=A0A669EQR5_ORENI|nr:uncharacterized protein LOC106096549 isoform X3 [Oreochromis niloticus]